MTSSQNRLETSQNPFAPKVYQPHFQDRTSQHVKLGLGDSPNIATAFPNSSKFLPNLPLKAEIFSDCACAGTDDLSILCGLECLPLVVRRDCLTPLCASVLDPALGSRIVVLPFTFFFLIGFLSSVLDSESELNKLGNTVLPLCLPFSLCDLVSPTFLAHRPNLQWMAYLPSLVMIPPLQSTHHQSHYPGLTQHLMKTHLSAIKHLPS